MKSGPARPPRTRRCDEDALPRRAVRRRRGRGLCGSAHGARPDCAASGPARADGAERGDASDGRGCARGASASVPASSSAPAVGDDDRRVLDELDRVRAVLLDAEDAALVVARLGGPRQPPGDQTIRIASPPVFASLEVASTSFEGAGLRVVVRLRAPIALGVLASRGAVFERDPAAGPDGRVTYVAAQAYPTRPFDLFTAVTFPREPPNLAAALIDSVTIVRRAPLGYH